MLPAIPALLLVVAACGSDAKSTGDSGSSSSDDTGSPTNPYDADGDGVGAATDCDDSDPDVGEPTKWCLDSDQDEYGTTDSSTAITSCDAPEGYAADCTDCDDADDSVHPLADELCDELDHNCDGSATANAIDQQTWYRDDDEDGFGDADSSSTGCEQPKGMIEDANDCDDTRADVHPGAAEICNGLDDDCDESTPEDGMITFTGWDGSVEALEDQFEGGEWGAPRRLTLATPGDYDLCQGEWFVTLDLVADVSLTGVHGSDLTVLSGGGLASVVTLQEDDVVATVAGLTLTDGAGTEVQKTPRSTVRVYGGAVYCRADAELLVTGSNVVDSVAEYGGGIVVDEGCSLTLDDSTVSRNVGSFGGGVMAYSGPVFITNSEISWNTVSGNGGGIYLYGDDAKLYGDIVDSRIFGNLADDFGGGVAAEHYIKVTFTSAHDPAAGIYGNFAYREGGGLYIGDIGDDSWVESQGCDFSSDKYDPNSPNDVEYHTGESWSDLGEDVYMFCDDETCTF